MTLEGIDNFIVTSVPNRANRLTPALLSHALQVWPNWRLVAPMPRHVQDGKDQACLVAVGVEVAIKDQDSNAGMAGKAV